MLKNISKLEWKVGEKIYQFICDSDSPTSDVKESLFQFLKFVGNIEDKIMAIQQDQQNQQEKENSIQEIKSEQV